MTSDLSIQHWPANNKMDIAAPNEIGDPSTELSVPFDSGGWIDMRDYEGLYVAITGNDVSSGENLTTLDVWASAGTKGKGNHHEAKVDAHANPEACDGSGETVGIEVTANQIAQEAADAGYSDLRYVSVRVNATDAADRYGAVGVRYGPRHATKDLTNHS